MSALLASPAVARALAPRPLQGSPPRPTLPRLTAQRIAPFAIWLGTLALFALTAPKGLFGQHTPFNHFALLAEAWLDGRLDLGGPPPAYTQNNDFARHGERFYVSFPPFPALLIAPLVALRGGAAHTPDGFFFLTIGSAAPSVLFVALEKLRLAGRSARSWRENIVITLLLPLATVFWFSAVQGTVWFAAHAVGAVLAAGYLWASIRAEHPIIAGACLVLGFATRTPLALAAPFFLCELMQRTRENAAVDGGSAAAWRRAAGPAARTLIGFFAPMLVVLAVLGWHNHARFGDVLEFGHRHLQVVWLPRIEKWGLFSLHYLGKNLGVALAGTPWFGAKDVPFQITAHGLALWITSPFLVLACWPRTLPLAARRSYRALALSAALVALPSLLYHNTGWVQFGYRFSNDYVVMLLAMLALGRRKLGWTFGALAAWSVAVNLFGALSFQRPGYEKYYRYSPRPDVYFEPD